MKKDTLMMRLFRHAALVMLPAAVLTMAPVMAQDPEPAYTLKTPIERIVANPEARAVLERELPGFTTLPQYDQFKTMSLEVLLAMFPNAVPQERVRAVEAALRAVPAPGQGAGQGQRGGPAIAPAVGAGTGGASAAATPAQSPAPQSVPQPAPPPGN